LRHAPSTWNPPSPSLWAREPMCMFPRTILKSSSRGMSRMAHGALIMRRPNGRPRFAPPCAIFRGCLGQQCRARLHLRLSFTRAPTPAAASLLPAHMRVCRWLRRLLRHRIGGRKRRAQPLPRAPTSRTRRRSEDVQASRCACLALAGAANTRPPAENWPNTRRFAIHPHGSPTAIRVRVCSVVGRARADSFVVGRRSLSMLVGSAPFFASLCV
jgi:hypothetical protein